MITTTTSNESRAEQLTLLPSATVPARFLLSRETRERGLRHGFYFSVEEYEYPLVQDEGRLALRLWRKDTIPGADVRESGGEHLTDLGSVRFEWDQANEY